MAWWLGLGGFGGGFGDVSDWTVGGGGLLGWGYLGCGCGRAGVGHGWVDFVEEYGGVFGDVSGFGAVVEDWVGAGVGESGDLRVDDFVDGWVDLRGL